MLGNVERRMCKMWKEALMFYLIVFSVLWCYVLCLWEEYNGQRGKSAWKIVQLALYQRKDISPGKGKKCYGMKCIMRWTVLSVLIFTHITHCLYWDIEEMERWRDGEITFHAAHIKLLSQFTCWERRKKAKNENIFLSLSFSKKSENETCGRCEKNLISMKLKLSVSITLSQFSQSAASQNSRKCVYIIIYYRCSIIILQYWHSTARSGAII